MTKVAQLKLNVKHSKRLDGRPVFCWRKDGKDHCSGYYLTLNKRLFMITKSDGMSMTLNKDNWTIDEIVVTER